MEKTFVFGKFLPFHKGHQALIQFALDNSAFLSVLVCCSNKEKIGSEQRVDWIRQTFPNESNLEIIAFNYDENILPNSSESSESVSKIWSETFKELFPSHTQVITSELYGDYIAEFMGIKHLYFDLKRIKTPISASKIKSDLAANWNFLPNSVKQSIGFKVVVLGTESTGKSTLCQLLSVKFSTNLVEEAGREIIPDSTRFTLDDLNRIVEIQTQNIQKAQSGNSVITIIDTNLFITESYAHYFLNEELNYKKEIEETNRAHLYLYCCADAPYVQDGTRLSEYERNQLDLSHRKVLENHEIDLIELKGNWEERFQTACFHLEEKMHNHFKSLF